MDTVKTNEMSYQLSISFIKKMLTKGLITNKEYRKMKDILLKNMSHI